MQGSKISVISWAQYVATSPSGRAAAHRKLVARKRELSQSAGCSNRDPGRWGATALPNLSVVDRPVSDDRLPIGCLSLVDDEIVGMAFLIHEAFQYPVDLSPAGGTIAPAHPWFAGLVVAPEFRGRGLARMMEQWIVQLAKLLANTGRWMYQDRRLWLVTGDTMLPWLLDMYKRWGWQLDCPGFVHKGERRYVMSKGF